MRHGSSARKDESPLHPVYRRQRPQCTDHQPLQSGRNSNRLQVHTLPESTSVSNGHLSWRPNLTSLYGTKSGWDDGDRLNVVGNRRRSQRSHDSRVSIPILRRAVIGRIASLVALFRLVVACGRWLFRTAWIGVKSRRAVASQRSVFGRSTAFAEAAKGDIAVLVGMYAAGTVALAACWIQDSVDDLLPDVGGDFGVHFE